MRSPTAEPLPWASLRARLTLWNTLVVLLTVTAALFAVRVGGRTMLFREADAVLVGEVNEVALALADFSPDTAAVIAELRRKAEGHEARGWFTQLLAADSRTVWHSDGCPVAVLKWPAADDRDNDVVQVAGYCFAQARVDDPTADHFDVRIGMPTAYLDEDVDALTRLLIPVGLGIAVVTPLAGYWLALRATRPLADILNSADQLRPTRLGDRLTDRGTGDELDHLARTINRLLDEVASHLERQQQFVADAAHELRSPLAAVRNTLEVAISRDRSTEEYRETLADLLEETQRLARLTNDLLLLAETAAETDQPSLAPVELEPLAGQTAAMFAGVADEQEVELVCHAPGGGKSCRVHGDARQLRQLLGNLLDNALRFTPVGGRVTITVSREGDEAVLGVTDTGCGIAADHLPRIFDRFYQADVARTRTHGRGGGLRLAICQSIAERHGGTIAVTSSPGHGARFVVRLPAATARHPT
jgi:two-component system heavy metal sensor histidine kinase CusS